MFRIENPFEQWRPPRHTEMLEHATRAAESASKPLVRAARRAAAQHGDWAPLARHIDVHWDQHGPYLGLHSEHEHAGHAFDLEYGDLDRAPRPVLRRTVWRHEHDVARHFTEHFVDGVMG